MLMWHRKPWLIDHGATLYFHHTPGWERDTSRSRAPFPMLKDHVLLPLATSVQEQDEALASRLTGDVLDVILGIVPDDWLEERTPVSAAEARQAYRRYFLERLAAPRTFVAEVVGAR
jgi:hypothetical protein